MRVTDLQPGRARRADDREFLETQGERPIGVGLGAAFKPKLHCNAVETLESLLNRRIKRFLAEARPQVQIELFVPIRCE